MLFVYTLRVEAWHSIGSDWDGSEYLFWIQGWLMTWTDVGRLAGSTANIFITKSLAGAEMNDQLPEVMSRLPVPIGDRIVDCVSLPPVAKGVLLENKNVFIYPWKDKIRNIKIKIMKNHKYIIILNIYPESMVKRITPRDHISQAASYPCFLSTSGATKLAV